MTACGALFMHQMDRVTRRGPPNSRVLPRLTSPVVVRIPSNTRTTLEPAAQTYQYARSYIIMTSPSYVLRNGTVIIVRGYAYLTLDPICALFIGFSSAFHGNDNVRAYARSARYYTALLLYICTSTVVNTAVSEVMAGYAANVWLKSRSFK